MYRIGYQGMTGSNSERATRHFIEQLDITRCDLEALVTSRNVVDRLKKKEIDYGVMAVSNNLGGVVQETYDAIKGEPLEMVDAITLQIHHCLFRKPEVRLEDIDCIASHVQALKQTQNSRLKFYPNLSVLEVEDTALAARYLYTGRLSKTTAVLCSKTAGELYHLKLVHENLEDSNDNYTEFQLFKLRNV